MKRFILLMLCLLLTISNMPVFSAGVETEDDIALFGTVPAIVVESKTTTPGNFVDVAVSLENNPGIISMMLELSYDHKYLTLIGVEDCGILGSAFHGYDVLCWGNDMADENFTENGDIVNLTFEVSNDAPGGVYPITLSYDNDNDAILNFDFEPVDFDIVNGSIEVEGTEYPAPEGGTLIGDYTFDREFSNTELGQLMLKDYTSASDAFAVSYPEDGGFRITRTAKESPSTTDSARAGINFIKVLDEENGIYKEGLEGVYAIDITFKGELESAEGKSGRTDLYISDIPSSIARTNQNIRMMPVSAGFTFVKYNNARGATIHWPNVRSAESVTHRWVIDTIVHKFYGYNIENGEAIYVAEDDYAFDSIATLMFSPRDAFLAEGSYIEFEGVKIYEILNATPEEPEKPEEPEVPEETEGFVSYRETTFNSVDDINWLPLSETTPYFLDYATASIDENGYYTLTQTATTGTDTNKLAYAYRTLNHNLVARDKSNRTEVVADAFNGRYIIELDAEVYVKQYEGASSGYYAVEFFKVGTPVLVTRFRNSYLDVMDDNQMVNCVYSRNTNKSIYSYSADKAPQSVSMKYEIDTVNGTLSTWYNGDLLKHYSGQLISEEENCATKSITPFDRIRILQTSRIDNGSYIKFKDLKITQVEDAAKPIVDALPETLVKNVNYVTETSVELPEIEGVIWASNDMDSAMVSGNTLTFIPSPDVEKEAVVTAEFNYADVNYVKTYTMTLGKGEEIVEPDIIWEELVMQDLNAISIPYKVESNINLPLMGDNGTVFTWTSSDPDIISPTGKFTRPSVDKQVVLTVTAEMNGIIMSKNFSVFVLAKVPSTPGGGSGGGGGTTGTICVENIMATAGDTVDVVVSMENNPGIIAMMLKLSYDNNYLTLTGVNDGGILGTSVHSNKLNAVPYTLSWANDTATENITSNGSIVKLTFKVSEDAPSGVYPITLSYNNEKDEIMNFDFETVDFDIINGSIEVEALPEPEPGEPLEELVMQDLNAISIPYKAEADIVLPASGANGTAFTWESSNNSVISTTGKVTIPSEDKQVTLTVTARLNDVVMSKSFDVIVLAKAPSAVEATICVESKTATIGSTVDVMVSLENNPGIISMLLELSYDKDVMTLKEVKDAGILGTTVHGNNLNAVPYVLSWANDTAPENFTVNGKIVTLTFKVSEDAPEGIYPITLSYNNDNDDILNFDFETVDFNIVNGSIDVKEKYTYKFLNEDGTVFFEGDGVYGATIAPPAENPVKESTVQYEYIFSHWEGYTKGMILTEDVAFTPVFTERLRKYTYKFLNDDGTVFYENTHNCGTMIVLPSQNPVKESTAKFDYTFSHWNGYEAGMILTGDVIFTPGFYENIRQYTYIFFNEDGSIYHKKTVNYGTVIEVPATNPVKKNTVQYTYTFSHWNGYTKGMKLTGDVAFTPVFDATINKYTYTFRNEDGSVFYEQTADYGTVIETPKVNPVKEATVQYTYTFSHWNGYTKGMKLTGDVTFRPVFDATINKYTYTFRNEDGSVLYEQTVDYGTVIDAPKVNPVKEATVQYTYAFSHWNGYTDGMVLTGDVTFRPVFDATVNKYTYTFRNEDGSVLYEQTADYGTVIEAPATNPVKKNTVQYTYTFSHWEGYTKGMVLTGDITFNPVFDVFENVYAKGDVNGDGKISTLDRITLSRYLAKWECYGNDDIAFKSADLNGDGEITNEDLVALGNYLAKWDGYENKEPTITVESKKALAGDTVEVMVSLENNPGIISMMLNLEYDDNYLTLTGVEDCGVLGTTVHNNNLSNVPYILSWANDTATENFTVNGNIVKLKFKVSEDTPLGVYPITLSYDNAYDEIVNFDFETVDFVVANGSIKVVETLNKPLNPKAPLINASSAKGKSGDIVDVVVSLNNNSGIISMMLNLDYDMDVLTLVGVEDYGVLGTAFHGNNMNKTPYILSWANDTAEENVTVNGDIVKLTFEINKDAEDGVYPVTLSYDNDNDEILDFNFKTVDCNISNGLVEVKNYIIGDVNGDDKISSIDRITLSRYLAKWDGYGDEDIVLAAADVNGDGKISSIDRITLSRYLAKWDGYETLPKK